MTDTPARSFLLPRLTALIEEAGTRGIARDVAVAVLIDLVTAAPFNTAMPAEDPPPQPDFERTPDDPVLVAGMPVEPPPVIGAQSEADFTRHSTWRE